MLMLHTLSCPTLIDCDGYAQDWDVLLLEMWGSIGNEYAVLSTSPPPLDTVGKSINDRWEVPHLCGFSWEER
jgi:hypothetical protein